MSDAATRETIRQALTENDVVLFMKGVPAFPQCGFSSVAARVLDHVGVVYAAVNVLENHAVREGIKIYSDWPTIPQLYVKGEFVGGSDIIKEMFETGELQQLFKNTGLAPGSE